MKVAFLLDPLHQLKAYKDSTVLLIQSAQNLGWECIYFTQQDLFCREGQAFANVHSLEIGDLNSKDWAKSKALGVRPLASFDLLFMRKDPPFSVDYIYTTYALDLAAKAGVLVVNHPRGLRDINEKFFTLHFPDCCPKTLVSQNIAQLRDFWQTEQEVIFKPLEGMGGQAVFQVGTDGKNVSVILELLTKNQTQMIMAQRYIPDIVTTGDKRIIVLNGKPLSHALARIPAAGELRGNLAAGAKGVVVPLSKRDKWLCEQIAPTLLEKGMYWVGLDVIGDYVTEINVTSPTCLREISEALGADLARDFLRGLEKIRVAQSSVT